MAAPRRAMIAGATGLVGARLLARLLETPAYAEVHALVRRPLPDGVGGAGAARVVEHLVDFTTLGRNAAIPSCDDLYVCLGTTLKLAGSQEAFRRVDFDVVVGVARLARRRGATRCVVVSALGADPASRVFYNRVKGEAEAAVAALGFEQLVIAQPSLLLGERKSLGQAHRPGEALAQRLAPLYAWATPLRWRPILAEHVATGLLRALSTKGPGTHRVLSDELFKLAR